MNQMPGPLSLSCRSSGWGATVYCPSWLTSRSQHDRTASACRGAASRGGGKLRGTHTQDIFAPEVEMSQGWVDEAGLWLCHVLDGKSWASDFTSFSLGFFSLVTGTKGGNRGRNQTYFSGFLCRLHNSYKAWSPESGTCRGSVNDRLFHSSSFSLPCQDVSLVSFPGLFLWGAGAGRRGGVDLATSAGAQPSLRALREVPGQDLGARQLQTGISSPAREKNGR